MDDKAIYNIGAIVRLTGIPATSLHAWERRYGFPHAERTPAGHRLYTDKDVNLLRNVKAQIERGVSARHAVAAVQQMAGEGHLGEVQGIKSDPVASIDVPSQEMHEKLCMILLTHNLEAADRLMGEMLAFYSPEEIILNVIAPLFNDIGHAWEQGLINVATEHLTSNYLRHRLLMWMVTGPQTHQVRPLILACPPGEWHEGSLLILGVLLRRKGWPVAYLGQNVPFDGLADYVRQSGARLVVMAAMREETAHNLAAWPEWIQQGQDGPLVLFGGRAFVAQPELQQAVAGIYLGDTLQEGLLKLENLLEKENHRKEETA